MLKKLVALVLGCAALSVQAQEATTPASCQSVVTEKKLAGAARTSFLKKCEKDAAARCEVASKEKKLHGAAKTSFEKKCVKDSVGS